jgi:hypothetical protein
LISPLTWAAGPRPYKHKFAAQFVCFGGALKKLQCRATDNKGLGLLTTTRFKHFAIAQYARFTGGSLYSRLALASEGTECEIHGYSAMQRAWDMELIFPIKDAASAALMVIKADCLHNAGVISDGEKQWVHSRARPFLADGTLKDAA